MREADRIEAQQAFGWKAAWFSFLAPLGSVFVFLAACCFASHSGPNPTSNRIGELVVGLVLGGALLVQIASLIMGLVGGCIADSYVAKVIAIIGFILSLVLGFVTVVLLLLATSGFGSGC